ncbi:hypothetical protein NYO98_06545 [Nocardioides sp. STR2]|uniref:Uncharacterized protein n=1 Tax=Nocardioides pini TaxID=2975053 RepID=A0ABT4CAF4_9ACTN|nr:hypothetical protein [Nocardioides pini]MCY4725930.1 hypothetical protein [Nocardioides pini]
MQARAGKASKAHGALPDGKSQVSDAEKAVSEPEAEANAKAQQALIAQVQAAPSPEIEKLCERIRDVIANKRPPDEDALAAAEPDQEAAEAGSQLNATVEGETQKVQGSYAPIDGTPTPGAPKQGQEAPPQPGVGDTPPVGAQAAVPDAVPAENVSLDKDAEESRKKAQDAGMNTAPAQLVQSGPVAEARSAQGELDQVAKEDPAKVMAGQQEALTKAEGDMAALQARTLAALEASRAATATGNVARQGAMVGSEESMRAAAAAEAQKIFSDAKTLVTAQLKDLPATAMAEWDAAKEVLASKFKADLKPVQDRVAERHSGAGGFVVGLWDAVTGLPDWAEEGYAKAETAFGDGVIAKLREISTKVNAVIIACDLIITDARTRIAKVFSDLPESMTAFAEQERAKFDGQLDRLHDDVAATRDNFNKELIASSSAAVDEVRAEIAELRKKAGGLIGRIVNAINRFIDDPVKFIIEGLLDLLGIPPAAFWAVVAKIKKVIGQIADDPLGFANNLLQGLADGFGLFFSNFGTHLLKGFLEWLLGGVKDVQVPKDVSLKSIITFFLQLMGITWPNIRKILVKLVGAKNVALVEKVYSMVSLLIEKGPEGIYEMIKEKLDPAAIVDQVVQMAVEFMVSAIIKQVSARIIMLFNPAGAILQALEAIYRVLKWVFQNAAKIFTLVETVVNGIADILAGNTKAFAAAVEKGLAMLIAPVISFIADYLSLGDLPSIVADKVKSMREWVLGMIESALTWLVEKGKALLAAMGIGKKDKKEKAADDDVGEDISWTVRNESHHLWIAEEGEHHEPMIASKPHPVAKALTIYREQAKKLAESDEEAAGEATSAIDNAASALAALTAALTAFEGKVSAGAEDSELAGDRAKVNSLQEQLKEAVAEAQEHLGLDDDERVKAAKKAFESSPFSTKEELAPFLDVSEGHARRIAGAWKKKGILFRLESSEKDPEGLNTFDPAVARWREVSPGNRQKYGYVNPKKTSAPGLEILSMGLLGRRIKGEFVKATAQEKRDPGYHQKWAHYESAVPGGDPDFMFDEAILGHAGEGASGHWNTKGHLQDREANYAWNQRPSSYHGPEQAQESAASGADAQRYELPTKERGSHHSWWGGNP